MSSHFQCDNCGGMKYAANITRKPGGLNMASACIKCDGQAAISSIQQMELASLAIHDDPKNRSRAIRNVRIADHGANSVNGQILKAWYDHKLEREGKEAASNIMDAGNSKARELKFTTGITESDPKEGTAKHRAESY